MVLFFSRGGWGLDMVNVGGLCKVLVGRGGDVCYVSARWVGAGILYICSIRIIRLPISHWVLVHAEFARRAMRV